MPTIPTPILSADFASGTADLKTYGRDSGFQVTRGTSSLVTTGFVADAGKYSAMLDNRTRRFDPNYLSGPYVTAGATDVVQGVPITVGATWSAVDYDILNGFADDWPQYYPATGKDQVAGLSATDATQLFSNASLDLTRPAETTGQRIAAIAAAVGYASTDITTGCSRVARMDRGTVSAWSAMTDCAMVEWGDLFFDVTGQLVFRDRNRIDDDAAAVPSAATFTDVKSTTNLVYADKKMRRLPIVNDCTVSIPSGTSVNVQDAASIAKPWGMQSLSLSLPFQTATQAQTYAQYIVNLYANQIVTYQSITLSSAHTPTTMWPAVLGLELGDLVTVTGTPFGVGSALTRTLWVRGISHDYANRDWQVTLDLQDASWATNRAHYGVSHYAPTGTHVFSL